MALSLADRVQETTTTTGTGTITLAGAIAGYQAFSSIGNGNTTYYAITSGSDWEVGIGTYTLSGTTLSRDTVLSSSNAGAKISLTSLSNVFVTYPAERAITEGYGTLPVANGGTGATIAATARTNLSAAASGANTDITSVTLTSGTITTTPTSGTDIVNKTYADTIASGINFHQAVRLATTTTLPAYIYNNGASGVGATITGVANGALSIDGVAAVVGNRVLVKNEISAAEAYNGVYTVTQVGSGAAVYILTRATDYNTAGTGVNQIDQGDFFLVTAGTTLANTSFVQQTPLPITVGTTGLTFIQFGAPITYSAGTGLTLAGTVFSLTAPVTVALGGTGATDAATALTNLGAYPAANPNGYTSNTGTVTSVTGTGTVNGMTLTGSVTSSGSLTLGGTLSNVDLTSQITGTLNVANGGTGASTLAANNVLLGNGTSAVQVVAPGTSGNVLTSNGTTWASTAPPSGVSFPQNIQTANYTLVLTDAGKQIFHPASDANIRTYTIPANASVAFAIGTVVLFTVENGGVSVVIGVNSDTLVFGSGTTGSLSVTPNNTLMAIKVTATKWMANYLYQTGSAAASDGIAVSHGTSPFVSAYPWNVNTGFGTKYTNPATLPTGNGNGVAFSPAGDAIAVAHTTTPFISAYPWTFSSGFGTKYTNPATLPAGTSINVAFSPAGDAIAVAHGTTPFITAYPWSAGTGFGTKYTDPATLPASTGNGVAFSPAGDAIAVAHATSPFITAYPWNVSTGFGTKYTDPATLPTGTGRSVAFSPAGDAIAVAHFITPFITAYPWSAGTGFGTKYTDPATLPTGNGYGVAFSPAGNAIAVAHDTSPFISAYPWSGSGFGTKYTDPATLPANNARGVDFSAAGDAIAVANTTTSPYITAYPWNVSTGFGTAYANPITNVGGNGTGVAFTLN